MRLICILISAIFFVLNFFTAGNCKTNESQMLTKKYEPLIKAFAGRGQGYYGDGGQALYAGFSQISGICADSDGNIYIADFDKWVVRKVNRNGVISTAVTQLYNPCGLACDSFGNLYAGGDKLGLRKIDKRGIITTIAGCGVTGYSGDGGPATLAKINSVGSPVLDSAGNVFFPDVSNNCIRKVDGNGIITTVAGNGKAGYSGDGGLATSAELNNPLGVAVDHSGNMFIADTQNYCIRKVDKHGIITTVAGNGVPGYSGDGGKASGAQIGQPFGIAVDRMGSVYFCHDNFVRKVDRRGMIKTVAGAKQDQYTESSGNDGPAIAAKICPVNIAIDKFYRLYISEYYLVREVDFWDEKGFLSPPIHSWEKLGNGDLPCDGVWVDHKYLSFSVYKGEPYVAFDDIGNLGELNQISVIKFNGKKWVTIGHPQFSPGAANYPSLYIAKGTPYLAYQDEANGNKIMVMRFNGKKWVTVGQPDFSQGGSNAISLFVYQKIPYVAYQDVANGNKVTVMQYSEKKWMPVGEPGFSIGKADFISLSVDYDGIFVAYEDEGNENKAVVMNYRRKKWVGLGNADVSAGEATCESLCVSEGKPYLAYRDSANGNKATVIKYNGNRWTSVGSPDFTEGEVNYISFDICNGTPYIAFQDAANKSNATVMKYNGEKWETVGNPGFTEGEAEYLSLFVYKNKPYLAFRFSGWTDVKAKVLVHR